MEVHHHPHVEKKSFKEYLLEGLMIFLAVTMGFIAENIREHIAEGEKEMQYMKSLVEDLGVDKTVLVKQLTMYEQRFVKYDSLTDILNEPIIKERNNTYYYLGRLATKDEVFPNNTRTFEQLKSTGAFRAIKNSKVVNSILEYYAIVPSIRQSEDIEMQETNEYRKLAVQVFNGTVFNQITDTADAANVLRPANFPDLKTTDLKVLSALSTWIHYIKNTRFGIYQNKKAMLEKGEVLSKLIQKEYRLENK
jgi:hypothetical protein